MILTPEYIFKKIECIHPDFLAAHGIRALVLDVDNTLTGDNSQVLEPVSYTHLTLPTTERV